MGLQIRVERGEILDQRKTSGIGSDRVEDDQRVVLSDIVVSRGILLVSEVESQKSRVWHVFLILSPRNALGI